ncbi:MAG TPA: hypothetical protein VIG33_09115, partial [Pseudobdellovibrionaceae bacterium]|jgi:hypothetical protein
LELIEKGLTDLHSEFKRAHENPVAIAMKMNRLKNKMRSSASASLFLFDVLAKNLRRFKASSNGIHIIVPSPTSIQML